MIRMEVGDENVGNIPWLQVEGCKLIHYQIFFVKRDGSHPAIKPFWEFFRLVEEAIGIARVEKHRAELGVTKQREHGGEMDRPPTSAVNGDVFGSRAITSVENVDFHNSFNHRAHGEHGENKKISVNSVISVVNLLPPL